MHTFRALLPRRMVGWRVALLTVAAGGGIALALGQLGAGAKDYSAYGDPQKPVLSFLLSDERNVEKFQNEFDLSDKRVKEILAVVHEEDRTLSREYEESDQIIEANKDASEAEIENKIAASDFDVKIERAVAKTKSEVEELLPEGRADDLGPWVDAQFQAEGAVYEATSEAAYQASSGGISCRVWASYYRGNTKNEVALPHWRVKNNGGRRVRITDVKNGNSAKAPVKDTGPWNIRDNYWQARKDRSMWKDLPRCVPEAQAAFFDNYNRGKDQFGREVRNPAGIDITPGVARRMEVWKKINHRGLIKVRVRFLWM